MLSLPRGSGFSIAGAGLALGAWTAEKAGLRLPAWLLIPVGASAALMLSGGIAIVLRDHRASRRKEGLPAVGSTGNSKAPTMESVGIQIKGGRNNRVEGNYVDGQATGILIEDSPGSSAARNAITNIEDRAFKGRLSRHHQLGLERLKEIENSRHQRHLPGLGGADFEGMATEDAKRQEQWWTEEARDLLSASPQLSEYFDHPSRMRQGPGVTLGTELDRLAGLMQWRVGRLGEMLEWI